MQDLEITLTRRQERLYTHSCDLWGIDRGTNANGTRKPDQLVLKAKGVPCFYEYTANVDDDTDAGRIKRMTFFTTDFIHLPVTGLAVGNGWWAVNTSEDNPNAGQVHKLLGDPQSIPGTERRRANVQMLMAMSAENPPTDLADYYNLNE